ncbi:MAG TPA: nucleotidyltransferase domain-containing protein [Methylococcus sp.]|nr:nucleotidyltransferase domain-containing protein [Methylococcus sp.]
MRLDPEIVPKLVADVREIYGPDAGLWLFGSRTDDRAAGGDIDLYVETADDSAQLDRYLECRRRLERLFGDRKIDLVVRPRTRPPTAIERIARKTGIRLTEEAEG